MKTKKEIIDEYRGKFVYLAKEELEHTHNLQRLEILTDRMATELLKDYVIVTGESMFAYTSSLYYMMHTVPQKILAMFKVMIDTVDELTLSDVLTSFQLPEGIAAYLASMVHDKSLPMSTRNTLVAGMPIAGFIAKCEYMIRADLTRYVHQNIASLCSVNSANAELLNLTSNRAFTHTQRRLPIANLVIENPTAKWEVKSDKDNGGNSVIFSYYKHGCDSSYYYITLIRNAHDSMVHVCFNEECSEDDDTELSLQPFALTEKEFAEYLEEFTSPFNLRIENTKE